MNITILDDYQDVVRTLACFAKLNGHHVTVWSDHTKDVDELAERLKDTEALVLIRERTPIPAALVARLPKLRLITQNGPWPHIDVAECSKRGVVVCCGMHARPSYATAKLTWGLIIAAVRHISQEMAQLKSGGWQRTVGTGLRGRTLSIYGYGKIGKQVAGYGKAFGMRVLVWGREKSLANAHADGYGAARDRTALFSAADVLSMHLRLVPETGGIVTAADLSRMKSTAVFVNTSRAGLVEPGALVNALHAGRPGFAAVDVYEDEPVTGGGHQLLKMDNVVCTPHLGYVERNQLELYFADQCEQVLAFARGSPINMVNPEVLDKR